MSRISTVQKAAFVAFAKIYDAPTHEIVSKGDAEEIIVLNQQDADVLNHFADNICRWVGRDYPDYEGSDEDINADAEKITFLISTILHESGFGD